MASLTNQPATNPSTVWHPISTVPGERVQAWVRWHDNSEGITFLAAGRDEMWWHRQGATHWRLVTTAEAAAYNRPGR